MIYLMINFSVLYISANVLYIETNLDRLVVSLELLVCFLEGSSFIAWTYMAAKYCVLIQFLGTK